MSKISISSPGVQIKEVDLSLIARPIGSTDVLITGFAPQGPTEELTNIGSVSEFESVFGTPTNDAEKYLYYSAKQILSQSPANLMVSRLPYGTGLGEGYGDSYSALVFPISSDRALYSQSSSFKILPPVSVLLSENDFYAIESNAIDWTDTPYQYVEADLTYPFGQLTNSTSSLDGRRVYGVSTKNFTDLSTEEALNLGLGVTSLTSAYLYTDGVWNVWEDDTQQVLVGTTNYYTNSSASLGLISLSAINGYYASVNPLGNYQENYGDPTLVTQTSAYSLDNGVFTNTVATASDILAGKGGLVILNKSKTAVNNLYEGYYLAIADNANINPSTDFDVVQSLHAVNGKNGSNEQTFVTVPSSRLQFTLTQAASSYGTESLSKVVEQYPLGFDFSTLAYKDSVAVVLFKLKSSQYNQDTVSLSYSIAEGYSGSLNSQRTQNNPNGGTPRSFFLDTVINNSSSNIVSITNPNISTSSGWTNRDGTPSKSVNVDNTAKAAYATGVYKDNSASNKSDLGQVDLKLQRFLTNLSNDDTTNVDIIADAGLSTIWATAYANKLSNNLQNYVFDETYTPDDIDDVNGLANKSPVVIPTGDTIDGFNAITKQFVGFANSRKDHIFISDPIRQIFVQGKNFKIASKKGYSFSDSTYWPIKNLYASTPDSSYVAVYGNWIKTNDVFTSKPVWIPSSGYAAAVIASSSQATYPWVAPAGFNRATLNNANDLGVNPTQKQRDLLYKLNINPIGFFNQDGFVIFGQKTFYRKPSAFDRINVRRLFLTLEKETQRLLKFYVFEPNSFSTRNRLVGSLTPVFEQAKLNDGCYDYLIVCDTTNNTPDVIDNNELRVAIYIQPVRAAEFILADFIATRTGVNFAEIISGGQ